MTIKQFVDAVKAGKLQVRTGKQEGYTLEEKLGALDPKDLEGMTAEAINLDIFPLTVTWEEAVSQISAVIEDE
jgi:hypothetical protein